MRTSDEERSVATNSRFDTWGLVMNSALSLRQLLATTVALALFAALSGPAGADAESAAHALAEKFSSSAGEAEQPKKRDALPGPQDANATRSTGPAAEHGEGEHAGEAANDSAEALRQADEADMLARARAELEARAAAAEAHAQAEAAQRAAAEARSAAETAREQERQRLAAAKAAREKKAREAAEAARKHDDWAALESQRDLEAAALAEKLRKAREGRSTLGGEPAREGWPSASRRSVGEGLGTTPARERHVTVLLRLEPGTKGIRRWNKSADPMLCVAESCYISRGTGAAAEKISRWQAFGPFVALGSRAGACNNSLHCVFRGVDLEDVKALIQPVDLRVLHHDRRAVREAEADTTCRLKRQTLVCDHTLSGGDWSAWIIPESLAAKAGPSVLQAALAASLPELAAQLGGR